MTAKYELVAVARTPQASGPPTLVELGPVLAPTITWRRERSRPGSVAFSTAPDRLPADIRARLRSPDTQPTELWVHRNGAIVAAGPLTGYQIQGGEQPTLTATAPGLLGYLGYMFVAADLTFPQVDQTTIGKTLVDQWQDLPYGHYGIDTSQVAASGVLRDRTYLLAEQHRVLDRLRELGEVTNGFDVSVDPATRELHLHYPSQGVDRSGTVVLDGRNVTDAGVVVSVAAGDLATEALGIGGDGETVLTSERANTTLRAQFGRAGVTESFFGVTEQATLDGHADTLLETRGAALFQPGPGLLPVSGAGVDDFDVGDLVTYEYDAGLGLQSGVFRVAALQVTVDESGDETLAVSFE